MAVGAAAVLAFALIGPLGVFGACLALLIANLVRATGALIAIAWLIAKERSRVPARSAAAVSPAPIDKISVLPRNNETMTAMPDTQAATADTLKSKSRGALAEGDRYLALLAIVLLGYALMGKGLRVSRLPAALCRRDRLSRRRRRLSSDRRICRRRSRRCRASCLLR